jgi:hypothetical protein
MWAASGLAKMLNSFERIDFYKVIRVL